MSGAFEGAGTLVLGAGVSVGGGKAGVLAGPTLGTAWSGGRFEGAEGLGVTGEVVVVTAGLDVGLLGLVSCLAGGCSCKAAEALITGWDRGVVTVAGGPAGATPSLMEAALIVIAPSLAAKPGKVCTALLVKALSRVIAAKVDCDGVAETVLSGGNWTEAFRAKFAADEMGVRVGVTSKGCTACCIALAVSLFSAA